MEWMDFFWSSNFQWLFRGCFFRSFASSDQWRNPRNPRFKTLLWVIFRILLICDWGFSPGFKGLPASKFSSHLSGNPKKGIFKKTTQGFCKSSTNVIPKIEFVMNRMGSQAVKNHLKQQDLGWLWLLRLLIITFTPQHTTGPWGRSWHWRNSKWMKASNNNLPLGMVFFFKWC